ncbi:hypothetical protein CAPTEDRAFT_90529 [Capitella teleta]|uniref:Protein phosphatase 1 regulatory subunit 42 n=1 Tax=Capitella teleta TaxID=283909 RepID=R7VI33_CAPTE|nr:hypothetical protein CAPTEDRAFT_90529 [Capitella teleta]|eukprot:ELU18264.1 hypothetical protein CAPTEDRAFT_90529 [Capitella teleta]
MVRLTMDLISRGTSGYTKKKRDEDIQHYLKRLTHLYLEGKFIDEIGDDLSSCRNLTVLYLYDNKLSHIPNLNQNFNLTHLYLQNNFISKMESLSGLPKLSKLYIGNNNITVIEGLDKLTCIQELHVENQKLPLGEKLLFDPRSLSALSRSLQVLNVTGNRLDSLQDLFSLTELMQFSVADNQLSDIKELAHFLTSNRHLWRLDLSGNPVCNKSKYRDRVIIMSPSLEVLDGKEITDTARQFLTSWQANKEAVKKRKESAVHSGGPESNGNWVLRAVLS